MNFCTQYQNKYQYQNSVYWRMKLQMNKVERENK